MVLGLEQSQGDIGDCGACAGESWASAVRHSLFQRRCLEKIWSSILKKTFPDRWALVSGTPALDSRKSGLFSLRAPLRASSTAETPSCPQALGAAPWASWERGFSFACCSQLSSPRIFFLERSPFKPQTLHTGLGRVQLHRGICLSTPHQWAETCHSSSFLLWEFFLPWTSLLCPLPLFQVKVPHPACLSKFTVVLDCPTGPSLPC